MGKKRKATDNEEFSRQSTKIRNPLVQQAHFRNFGESGVDVSTTTVARQPPPANSKPPVTLTPLNGLASEPECETKKQTQVGLFI